ncbi:MULTISPECIES: tannase/feruloyl esterase family alpha/beta hydrolase [unclassified Variovorax]|uniref:tannase/feruloyl esterase family alpha/beta hydrolase n=1 Tax=unclassified Variovorax TaxID=663243 RepID=UPI003F5125E2
MKRSCTRAALLAIRPGRTACSLKRSAVAASRWASLARSAPQARGCRVAPFAQGYQKTPMLFWNACRRSRRAITDLSAFFARGGKLIIRENAADRAQSALMGIEYYKAVVARLGQSAVDQSSYACRVSRLAAIALTVRGDAGGMAVQAAIAAGKGTRLRPNWRLAGFARMRISTRSASAAPVHVAKPRRLVGVAGAYAL